MPLSLQEMGLWVVAAMLTVATVAYLLRTLRQQSHAGQNPDLAVYKDQLAEIDRDVERGSLSTASAEGARLEISRRLLAAADIDRSLKSVGYPLTRTHEVILAIILPFLALGIYLGVGSPGLPGQPYQERISAPLEELPVEGLVARLEQRLEEEPDDVRGWRLIAPVYLQLGRYGAAINAFGRIMQIEGKEPDALAGLGEALTLSGDGLIPSPAIRAFEAALEMDEKHPKARFYLALAKAQAGDLEAAIGEWQALLSDTPAGAAWRSVVEDQITAASAAKEAR